MHLRPSVARGFGLTLVVLSTVVVGCTVDAPYEEDDGSEVTGRSGGEYAFGPLAPRLPPDLGEVCGDARCFGYERCGSVPDFSTWPPRSKRGCVCKNGYDRSERGTCVDVDECSAYAPCGASERCVNTRGSYKCEAIPCGISGTICPETASCVWEQCQCKPGYWGDGVVCVDVDECVTVGCPRRSCLNHPGGYACGLCQAPFVEGSGGACVCPAKLVDTGTGCVAPTPTSYTPLSDYPFRADDVNWRIHPQGVATDASFWYVAHETWIGVAPLGEDLHRNLEEITLTGTAAWNHYGDPDVYKGRVYIPLEGAGGPSVASVDTAQLRSLKAYAPVRTARVLGEHAAWVAINPVNGHMYISRDYDWANSVDEYSFTDDSLGLRLTHIRQISLTGLPDARGLQRLQGGTFGPDGTMYLVSFDWSSYLGGIYVFDQDGHRRSRIPVDYELFETLEGITVADMNDGHAPNISGDVHVVLFSEPVIGKNRLYFKHFRANF